MSLQADLRDLAPTDSNVIKVLGHKMVKVKPSAREKQCCNCGENGHEWSSCPLPTMDQLMELYGQYAFDPSASAVEEKKRMTKAIYEKTAHSKKV